MPDEIEIKNARGMSEQQKRIDFSLGLLYALRAKKIRYLADDKERFRRGINSARNYSEERKFPITPASFFDEEELICHGVHEDILIWEDNLGEGDKFKLNIRSSSAAQRRLTSLTSDCPEMSQDDFLNLADEFLNGFENENYSRKDYKKI